MTIKIINYLRHSDHDNFIAFLNASSFRFIDIDNNIINNEADSFYPSYEIIGNAQVITQANFNKNVLGLGNIGESLHGAPLPIAIRYVSESNFYVIERPPFKTSVRFHNKKAHQVKSSPEPLCEVWIPWTVVVLKIQSITGQLLEVPIFDLYFNDKPLSSIEDTFAVTFTPNTFSDSTICWGESMNKWNKLVNDKAVNPFNVSDVYHYFINEYFSGGWNQDLGTKKLNDLSRDQVGHFTTRPLDNPMLQERAIKQKINLINDNNDYRYVRNQSKNNFLLWSLLTLEEVLETITDYKRTLNAYSSSIISLLKKGKYGEELNAEQNILVKIHRDFAISSTSNWYSWKINISFDSKNIIDFISSQYPDYDNKRYGGYDNRRIYCSIMTMFLRANTDTFTQILNDNLQLITNSIFESKENGDNITEHIVKFSSDDINPDWSLLYKLFPVKQKEGSMI